MDNIGALVFDNADKAELLNQYFASTCVKDNNILPLNQHDDVCTV